MDIKRVQIRVCDYLPFSETISLFSGIRNFSALHSNKYLHLSLQNDFKSAQNTKNNIGVWTSSGKREISIEEYLEFVKISDCDTFDCYSDSDTIAGSKKRLQKSVENSLKWGRECVNVCKKKYPELLLKICAVVSGGNDYRRRQQSVVGLKKIEEELDFKFKLWVIENLELENAVEIYQKILEIMDLESEIVISFCRSKTRTQDLKIFDTIKNCYQINKCIFQTNAYFCLADKYLGIGEDFDRKLEADGDGPPTKKQKMEKYTDFQILDFSDSKKYKMETDKYLIKGYSHAYLHHLQDTGEFLGKTLLVINNLRRLAGFCSKLLK